MENKPSTPKIVPQQELDRAIELNSDLGVKHYAHILSSFSSIVLAIVLSVFGGTFFVLRLIDLLQNFSVFTGQAVFGVLTLVFHVLTLILALGGTVTAVLVALTNFKLRKAVNDEKDKEHLVSLSSKALSISFIVMIFVAALFLVDLVSLVIINIFGSIALKAVAPQIIFLILSAVATLVAVSLWHIVRLNHKANQKGKEHYIDKPVESIGKLEFFYIGTGNSLIKLGLFLFDFVMIFVKALVGIFVGLYKILVQGWKKISQFAVIFYQTFMKNSFRTKLSYVFMGVGHSFMKRPFKTVMYLLMQIGYFVFMLIPGGGIYWLSKFDNLGDVAVEYEYVCQLPMFTVENCPENALAQTGAIFKDNSMLITLYSVATLLLSVAFILLYWLSIRGVAKADEKYTKSLNEHKERVMEFKLGQISEQPKFKNPLPTFVQELKELLNGRFHLTTLTVPTITISIFTVLPLIFMILLAFTNYNQNNGPPNTLFTWVGLQTFAQLFTSVGGSSFSKAFGDILQWTFIWAFFATFSNYIFGLILAMIINRRGIKFKKLWRTVFVITIAVPQFVTLLLMSRLLNKYGPINSTLLELGWISQHIEFLTRPLNAKITVILVNVWVGVPYTMLITSGILMNIPGDLYESARIDGASPFTQFTKITLPYMLFVTGPYLITQFIGNINNFNVIFFLTGGGPSASLPGVQYGKTDILVTWLYSLTVGGAQQQYSIGSALGIFIFLISVFITLSLYSKTSAATQEGDFA